MKSKITILVLLAFLLGCKKEEINTSESSIKINYKVGDHFSYKREFIDYKTDTFEILIPKDTFIDNKNCLVYIKREKGFRDDITYIEQTDSSINTVGYWYNQNNQAVIFSTPVVLYLNPLKIGSNWLTRNMADTGRMSVTSAEAIKIDNKYYICMKVKHHRDIFKPDDPSMYYYTEYIDAKGVAFSKNFYRFIIKFEDGVPVLFGSHTIEISRIPN